MQELQVTAQQTNHKAEMALDITESLREENSFLRQDMADLKDKNILIERQFRSKHLTFQGLPEGTENPQELLTKVNIWLSSLLESSNTENPPAMMVYRLGTQINQNRQNSRDVVVELAEDATKLKILEIARVKGHVMYHKEKIFVFQDLPPATIQIRSTLKPVTEILQDAKVKYRWLPTGKLSIYYNGQQLIAGDKESGKKITLYHEHESRF